MTDSIETLYEQGLKRYEDGASPAELIPLFKDICDRAPRNSAGWSSLAWLYLLTEKPDRALKAAQKSVKLDKAAPQARVNLAIAMLDTKKTGVREHIEAAQHLLDVSDEVRADVIANLRDGLKRRPDWKSLKRICEWLGVS
ncbi:hypothetical protein KR51_00009370 [Rubidibacter lacunae KORDI 51-2]|uniref:TPR repeat protein n=1 Tax=Rubidibacter lacunae KORDI 51-2 TaxID=582515 RepID=U5DNG3_9CHRO|nr:hypothetical protein [Rubidibacter lacunae]ERN42412.1 hypothetical protein KR51_00009370 [Rubidibacter lacunae KORDI 51-2]